jgi:hypothetical protein
MISAQQESTGTTPLTKKMVVLDFKEESEPLLVINNKRFVLFPIQYQNVFFFNFIH